MSEEKQRTDILSCPCHSIHGYNHTALDVHSGKKFYIYSGIEVCFSDSTMMFIKTWNLSKFIYFSLKWLMLKYILLSLLKYFLLFCRHPAGRVYPRPWSGINIGLHSPHSHTLSTDNVPGRSFTITLLETEGRLEFFQPEFCLQHNSSNFSAVFSTTLE